MVRGNATSTDFTAPLQYAVLVHLVERLLAMQKATGSSPVYRSIAWPFRGACVDGKEVNRGHGVKCILLARGCMLT